MVKNGENNIKANLDWIGIVTALICAIHCLTLPLLLTFSALSGFMFLTNSITEAIFLIISIVIGRISFIPAVRTPHKNVIPITLWCTSILILLLTHIEKSLNFSKFFTISGASLLIIAHHINYALRPKSKLIEK